MKIGFYCESPADQAAMAVFTEALLGEPPEPINMDLAARGVHALFNGLEAVFRGVHYNSDAEGLVVVVDCDSTTPHEVTHDDMSPETDRCRLCRIRKILSKVQSHVGQRPHQPNLKVAVGLTVPTIEAWYLVGVNRQVGEAAWKASSGGKCRVVPKQLKKEAYGTDRPSLELETARAIEHARRVIQDIKALNDTFPAGFGEMAREIRSWKQPTF